MTGCERWLLMEHTMPAGAAILLLLLILLLSGRRDLAVGLLKLAVQVLRLLRLGMCRLVLVLGVRRRLGRKLLRLLRLLQLAHGSSQAGLKAVGIFRRTAGGRWQCWVGSRRHWAGRRRTRRWLQCAREWHRATKRGQCGHHVLRGGHETLETSRRWSWRPMLLVHQLWQRQLRRRVCLPLRRRLAKGAIPGACGGRGSDNRAASSRGGLVPAAATVAGCFRCGQMWGMRDWAGACAAGTVCFGRPVRRCSRWAGCAGLRGWEAAAGLSDLCAWSKGPQQHLLANTAGGTCEGRVPNFAIQHSMLPALTGVPSHTVSRRVCRP